MLHYFLVFVTGLGLGWLLHYPPSTPPSTVKILSKTSPCLEVEKEVIVYLPAPIIEEKKIEKLLSLNKPSISKDKKPKIQSLEAKFSQLLYQNLFDEAMGVYMEADEEITGHLQNILVAYFQQISNSKPLIAIEQMLEFHFIASESSKVMQVLIELYKTRKEYKDAILLLSEMIQMSDSDNNLALIANLLSTSQIYLKELKEAQTFNAIIIFLEERIMFGIESEFYTLLLAQHYIDQHQYFKARASLVTLEFAEKYKTKTEELLALVAKKIELNEAYTYKIPLEKRGKHFLVQVYMGNIPLTLMLDTGASITTVYQEKLKNLTIVRNNVRFSTAGGDVYNHVYNAKSFTVGEIELFDFQVAGSAYYDKGDDGLLGMNFLNRFDFKIDQKEGILYLIKTE